MNSELAQSQDSKGSTLTQQVSSPHCKDRVHRLSLETCPEDDTGKIMHFSLPLLSETSHSWFVGCFCVCVWGGWKKEEEGNSAPGTYRSLDGSGTQSQGTAVSVYNRANQWL